MLKVLARVHERCRTRCVALREIQKLPTNRSAFDVPSGRIPKALLSASHPVGLKREGANEMCCKSNNSVAGCGSTPVAGVQVSISKKISGYMVAREYICVALAAVAWYLFAAQQQQQEQHDSLQSPLPGWPRCAAPTLETITPETFNYSGKDNVYGDVASIIGDRCTPLVLTGLPAAQRWSEGLGRRTLSELGATPTPTPMPRLSNVYVQNRDAPLFFNHDPGARMARFLDGHPAVPAAQQQQHREEELLLSELFRLASTQPSQTGSVYWAGPIDDSGLLGLATDGITEEDIATLSPSTRAQPGSAAVHTRMWIASEGVQAALHYDVYNNLLVQLVGTKRVWLLPPSELPNIHLYPSLHPRYRQSQLPSSSAVRRGTAAPLHHQALASIFPNRCNVYSKLIQVDLQPRQALYIPPFWLHSVETLPHNHANASRGFQRELSPPQQQQGQGQLRQSKASVSINLWVSDEGLANAEELFVAPIPFDEEWAMPVTAAALVTFANQLVATAILPGQQQPLQQQDGPGGRDANSNTVAALQQRFFETMVSTRYEPLVKQQQHEPLPDTDKHRHPLLPRQLPRALRGRKGGYCGDMPDRTVCSRWPKRFLNAAADANATLAGVSTLEVRVVYVQDYIEELIGAFVGEAHVFRFLAECLAKPPPEPLECALG